MLFAIGAFFRLVRASLPYGRVVPVESTCCCLHEDFVHLAAAAVVGNVRRPENSRMAENEKGLTAKMNAKNLNKILALTLFECISPRRRTPLRTY